MWSPSAAHEDVVISVSRSSAQELPTRPRDGVGC
jgi:hypothetical protein